MCIRDRYLLIVVIVTSLLFTLLIHAITTFQEQTQLQEMKKEIEIILNSAEYLATHAQFGSKITKSIIIPPPVTSVSFGPPSLEILTTLGFQNSSSYPDNMYVICYDDGRIEPYFADVSFVPNHHNVSHILSEGHHDLSLELTMVQGKTYVNIST